VEFAYYKNISKEKPTQDRAVVRVGPIMKNKQNKRGKYTTDLGICQYFYQKKYTFFCFPNQKSPYLFDYKHVIM